MTMFYSNDADDDDDDEPPLEQLLTVVVTTSPIRSNPSTEVLERALATLRLGGDDLAFRCPKVIVCDGVRTMRDDEDLVRTTNSSNSSSNRKDNVVSRKHSNAKQALRNGIATPEQAERYRLFKERLRALCRRVDDDDDDDRFRDGGGGGSVLAGAVVVELEERHGYGFALREAVRHHVRTPYVLVVQHDRTLMRRAPVREVVAAMRASARRNDDDHDSDATVVRYVGLSQRSNLFHRDVFLSRYGREATEELETLTIRPPELAFSDGVYGEDGASVRGMLASAPDGLRRNLSALRRTYWETAQGQAARLWEQEQQAQENSSSSPSRRVPPLRRLSLTPTLFWYDNVHVCETAHYRDFVFDPRLKLVARGGFVEDKLSPSLVRAVERRGLREGHRRFGCYLLDDHSGFFFTGHLDGGSWLTTEEKKRAEREQREKQRCEEEKKEKEDHLRRRTGAWAREDTKDVDEDEDELGLLGMGFD